MNFFSHKFFGKFLFKKEAFGKELAEYFAFAPVRVLALTAVGANLLLWLLAFLIKRGLHQDLAILHYNITFGIDYLAPRAEIYYLPLIGLAILLLNIILSFLFFKKDKYLVNLLLISAVAVEIMVGLGLYSVYIVNFVKIF